MTSFDAREKAFENKYVHDEKMAFRVNARRLKLVGFWAAERLGKIGAEAEEYAKAVVMSDFDAPGEDDVIEKLQRDFAAANLNISLDQIRQQMQDNLAVAKQQLGAEPA